MAAFRVAERRPTYNAEDRRQPVARSVVHEPACALASRLAAATGAIARAEPVLVRAQAMLLAWLSENHRSDRFAFGSVRAYAQEMLGMEASTVRNRIALHRILAGCAEAEAAYLSGKVSACQILALRPVLVRETTMKGGVAEPIDHAEWLVGAERTPVAALRRRVKEWREEHRVEEVDPEPEGRSVSFSHPRAFGLIWETAMEQGRRVLGYEAPQWKVLEAVLAETGFAGAGEEGADPLVGEYRAGSRPGGARGRGPDGPAACGCGGRRGDTEKLRIPGRGPAERTLAEVTKLLEDLADIAGSALPGDPLDAHVRLLQIRALLAPLDLLLGRLLRDLRDTGSLRRLGYPHMRTFLTEALGLSERTARQRRSEAVLFEERPALARAYAEGRIGLAAAHRIARLAIGRDLDALIRRAAELTSRQQQREYCLMMNLRLLERTVGYGAAHAVLPAPGLEKRLREALRKTRCSRKRMNRFFHARGIAATAATAAAAVEDPAEDQALMARLEWMVEQLLAVGFEDPPDPVEELPVEQRQTFAFLPRAQGTGRKTVWMPEPVRADLEAAVERLRERRRREEEAVGEVDAPVYPYWAALLTLLVETSRVWRQVDPQKRPRWKAVFERDRWRCQAPGCRCRRNLQIHHIVFRARGGKNRRENLIVLCAACHQRLVHAGHLVLNGEAPENLWWMLGRSLPGGPLRVLKGERIVWRREIDSRAAQLLRFSG